MSEKKLRGLLGLGEKVSGRKTPSLYRDVQGEYDSINQGLLGMMPFAGMTQPGRWFHGTPHQKPIHKFQDHAVGQAGGGATFDTLLGPHLAKDTNVANKFAFGLNKGGEGMGQVMPMSIKGKGKELHQPINPKTGESQNIDLSVVTQDVGRKVFFRNKELFVDWVKNARKVDDKKARKWWSQLKKGSRVKVSEYTDENGKKVPVMVEDFADFVRKYDSGLWQGGKEMRTKLRDEYRRILADEGYTHVTYKNTAPAEIGATEFRLPYYADDGTRMYGIGGHKTQNVPKAEDLTSAIILDQSALAPSFGRGLIK